MTETTSFCLCKKKHPAQICQFHRGVPQLQVRAHSTLVRQISVHPMLKHKYISIKYAEAILLNSTRKQLRFKTTKMLVAV